MSAVFDFSSFPTLTTERLRLRQLNHDDAEAIVALFSSPEVLRFLNQEQTDSVEKAVRLINWLNGLYDKHEAVQWAITLQGQNRLIGTCGNYAWDQENRHIDVGYHLLPSYWGQGYATEACHAIVGWSFEHMNLHRVQADCTVGNVASERVLLKCGFKVEGIWRENCWEHGRFVDIKQFGLLHREYRAISDQ